MDKSKDIANFLNEMFPKEIENVSLGKCPLCSRAIVLEDFTDELSKREFGISGMCQICQDKFFS